MSKAGDMQYRLGRNPSIPDPRTLKFGDYLIPSQLPSAPSFAGYFTEVWQWPMFGNDQYGDCTFAALAHQMNAWTKYATGVERGPLIDDVLKAYFALSPNDTGADMLSTLKYTAKTGIGEGNKIAAYVQLDLANHAQLETAIYLFGNVYLGLALPDAIVNDADPLTIPWIVPTEGAVGEWAPNPNNGHAIAAVGYGVGASYLDIVTWGKRIGMGWSAYCDYVDEAYALVSTQWIAKAGNSPSGFDLAQLLLDRAALSKLPA